MCRRITKPFATLALMILCAATTGAQSPATPSVTSAPHTAVAARTYYPEARMRKMHLVRPDLILYPIFYDIYC